MSLLRRIADVTTPQSQASAYRRRRFMFFRYLIRSMPGPIHVLDMGGSPEFWERVGFTDDPKLKIVVVNLREEGTSKWQNLRLEIGDARRLPYPDESFDVVVSNSVIEHVGNLDDQMRMAEEVQRLADHYFIQTPNRHFPIEPHFLFPFFQYLPLKLRATLLSHFDLGWHQRQTAEQALRVVQSIRLVSIHEVRVLFPQARLYRERFWGLTKSFIIVSGWAPEVIAAGVNAARI